MKCHPGGDWHPGCGVVPENWDHPAEISFLFFVGLAFRSLPVM